MLSDDIPFAKVPVRIAVRICQDVGLAALRTYVLLRSFDNPKKPGTCYPSLAEVAELARCDIRTIRRDIAALVESRLVVARRRYRKRGRGRDTNIYTFPSVPIRRAEDGPLDSAVLGGKECPIEDADLGGRECPIQLVNTDPPYNVRVEPRSSTAIAAGQSSYPDLSRKMHHQGFDVARGAVDPKKARAKMRAKDRPLEGDFVSDEAFAAMLRAWFGQIARVLDPGRSFYIWGGYANLGNYPPALRECGLYFSQGIVWDKEHPVLTRKDFMGAFELCFYG